MKLSDPRVCRTASEAGIVPARARRLTCAVAFAVATLLNQGQAAALCGGDCDGYGAVTVDEVVMLVVIALGTQSVDRCEVGDADADGSVTVDEIIAALTHALNGCPLPPQRGACSNRTIDLDEQCDDGGYCIGGPLAGTACTSEAQCVSGGACFGGLDDLRACESDDECRGGSCRRCRPAGGDGCAANCTFETHTVVDLVPGIIDRENLNCSVDIAPGTSGAHLFGPFLYISLPFTGRVTLTTGRTVDGVMPVALRADAIHLGAISVSTIACACYRFPKVSTCGGTFLERDGTASLDCTTGFEGSVVCPIDKPCAPVSGPGNAGSGFITCGGPPNEIDVVQDCNGTPGAETFPPVISVEHGDEAAGSPTLGNALFMMAAAFGNVVGSCSGSSADYGPDGEFCTTDDPVDRRGRPTLTVFGTSATASILNPGDFEGDINGPHCIAGAPFTCLADGSVDLTGGGIASGFTTCDLPTVSDVAVPAVLFFDDAPIIPGGITPAP